MDDRQRQLEDRMEQNRIDQEESLKQRELLIREMEIAQQMTHREKEETEAQKEALKLNLKEQVYNSEFTIKTCFCHKSLAQIQHLFLSFLNLDNTTQN